MEANRTDFLLNKMGVTTPVRLWALVAVGLAWGALVLTSYFNLLLNHAIVPLNLQTTWTLNPILLAPLAISLLFGGVVWLLPERLAGKATVMTIALITIIVLLNAADPWLWFKATLLFGSLSLAGLGAKWLYDRLLSADIPYWAGLILMLILFQYWLFAVGLLGIFWATSILPFGAVFVGLGMFDFYRRRAPITTQMCSFFKQLSRLEAIFLVGLWLVLSAGFIGASAPETYSDAMRMHAPFMANVVRTATLTPDYYNYSHIMLSPLQLLGAGGYLFLGELGAKWLTFLMGVWSVVIIIIGVGYLTGRRSLGLMTTFLIISTPYFWQWLTTVYQDLPLTGFSLAGLLALGLAHRANPKLGPLAGLFLGFAAATKLTTVLFVASVLAVFVAALWLTRSKPFWPWLAELWRNWWQAAVLFGLAMLPWYALVWHWTGNPFFPALDSLFSSPYATEALKSGFYRAEPAQQHPHGWLDALIYPWTLTFQTRFFSETLDGALGPWLLLFCPLILLGFGLNYYRGDRQANGMMTILLVMGGLDIAAISIGYLPQMRYFMAGLFLVLACAFGVAWKNILPWLQFPGWASTLGALALTSGSLLVLFGWGIYVDSYARLPWRVYAGYQTPAEYLKARTGGVEVYINRHIHPGETVLATNFEQLNTIQANTIYLSDWLPPQAIGLETAAQFEAFLAQNNARYWIVNRAGDLSQFEALGIPQTYWTEDKLARSLGVVDLYTLKPELELPPPEVLAQVSLSGQDGWYLGDHPELKVQRSAGSQFKILPAQPQANYIEGELLVKTDQAEAGIVAEQIWLGPADTDMGRCVYQVVGHKSGPIGAPIACGAPQGVARLALVIYPQANAGPVEIVGGEIVWQRWAAEPPLPLTIVDYDPTQIKAGQDFNVQRDGVSRLRIKTQHATEHVILVAGAEKLSTSYVSPEQIMVRLPKAYYTAPGAYQFYLFDPLTRRRSNTATFVVTE